MQRVGSLEHNKRGLVQNPVWDGHDLFKGRIAIYRNTQVVFTFVDVEIPKDLRGKVSNKTHLGLSMFDNAISTFGGKVPTAESSSAIDVLLDFKVMTGQVIELCTQPEGMYGALFCSVQFLVKND